MWSTVFGAIAGALGSFLMTIVVQAVMDRSGMRADLIRMLGASVDFVGGDARVAGLAVATVLGGTLGAPLGLLTRRLLAFGPRLVFFSLFLPILWIFTQALVLTRFAPSFASALPLTPVLLGVLGYGACLALVKPIRLRNRPATGAQRSPRATRPRN